MLDEILKYQELDSQLVKMQRELENSDSKKVVNKMVAQVKEAQNKLVALEKSAAQLIAEYEVIKQEYEAGVVKLKEIKSLKFEGKSENELKDNSSLITKQIASMLSLNKEISNLSKKIVTMLGEFEKTKKQGFIAKQKYKEFMDKYSKDANIHGDNSQEIKKKLAVLEKSVDPKLLQKYKKMRADNKFPIFVPLVNNACGACAMSLPNGKLELLNEKEFLECENCHRMIYVKKD